MGYLASRNLQVIVKCMCLGMWARARRRFFQSSALRHPRSLFSLNFTTPYGADTLLYTATHSRINAYTRSLRQTFQDRGRKHFTILALLSPATHSLNAPPTGQKANAASLPYHSDGQILHLTALFIV